MSHPVERPATPAAPSTLLQEPHPSILSESSGSESDPVSSTVECPCCRLPPVPELSTLAEAIPQLDLNTSATLEEQVLKTLTIQPTVGSTVRAAAVVPQDQRAAGYLLLIDLLCHRMFSTFKHQGGIRNFSVQLMMMMMMMNSYPDPSPRRYAGDNYLVLMSVYVQ
jgi:hypothetical protein